MIKKLLFFIPLLFIPINLFAIDKIEIVEISTYSLYQIADVFSSSMTLTINWTKSFQDPAFIGFVSMVLGLFFISIFIRAVLK